MIAELESLIKLQHIDARISELVRAKEGFPATIAALEGSVKKSQDGLDALKKKQNEALDRKKEVEGKIADAKAHLDKSQDLLNSIKTNREYDAVHTQIENFKHLVSGGDAQLKSFDQEIERLQQSVDKAKEELDVVTTEKGPQIAELKSKIDTISASISLVTSERDAVIALVPKALLRTYDHILKRRKNGQVLSFVNGDSRTCSICHKILEMQLVNEIRKANQVMICQNCGSLFVWNDATDKKA
jgi:predicted  nucleic acid-binding Zn-ribbon protein